MKSVIISMINRFILCRSYYEKQTVCIHVLKKGISNFIFHCPGTKKKQINELIPVRNVNGGYS